MPLLRSGLYRALLLLLPATRREVLAVPLEDCTGNLLPLWERDISREAVCWPGTASNICLCRVNPLKERHGERLAGLHIVRHLPEKDALPQQRISSCQVAATATGEVAQMGGEQRADYRASHWRFFLTAIKQWHLDGTD